MLSLYSHNVFIEDILLIHSTEGRVKSVISFDESIIDLSAYKKTGCSLF